MHLKRSSCFDEDIDFPSRIKNTRMKYEEFVSSSFFIKLPLEVLLYIIHHISRQDLLNLCSTSKELRSILQSYIFQSIKVTWHQLIHIDSCPLSDVQKHYVSSLRVTTSSSKDEWTYPFHELFATSTADKFRGLEFLELTSSGSTSFFKYCTVSAKLKHLKIIAGKDESLFSLEHVRPFINLESLELAQFHIGDFEEDDNLCPNLRTLNLRNCTWDYPFDIENFGRNKIIDLSLNYTNSFIMSERFRGFLMNPHFAKLERLQIINMERNLKLTISVEIMKLIRTIPTLKCLILRGNIYNETLNNFTNVDYENCMNYIAMNNVKVFYSSLFNEK